MKSVVEITRESLLSIVCSISLGFNRINDAPMGPETYTIEVDPAKEEGHQLYLQNSKGKQYEVSVNQLAALRISEGKVKEIWLDEFKDSKDFCNLQMAAHKLVEDGVGIASVQLKVVGQLKMRNHQIEGVDVPIYIDRCYTGALDYLKQVRELVKLKPTLEQKEYYSRLRNLRDGLYSTPLKPGMDEAKNEVKLPVFKIII
jgi:hypothetical protein